jgi:hypothetical protein
MLEKLDRKKKGDINLNIVNNYYFIKGSMYKIIGQMTASGIRKPELKISITAPDGDVVFSQDTDGNKESFMVDFIAEATGNFVLKVNYIGETTCANPSADITVNMVSPTSTEITLKGPDKPVETGTQVTINGVLKTSD